jgi:hypothetical protein
MHLLGGKGRPRALISHRVHSPETLAASLTAATTASPPLADGAVLTDQLGTPRGRCDEHISKFFLSYETKV